jgi:hypothetical protein
MNVQTNKECGGSTMGFCDRISGKSSVCYGSSVTLLLLLLLLLLDPYGLAFGFGTRRCYNYTT